MSNKESIWLKTMVVDEEYMAHQLRANTYSLLAHLFVAEPNMQTVALLRSISEQSTVNKTPISMAWVRLFDVARTMDIAVISAEFQQLFIGVARGELMPYGCYYQSGFLMDKPLVVLRQDLQVMGFTRQENSREPEDHVAALCEVMALLVREQRKEQFDFFQKHMNVWMPKFFKDINDTPSACFYQAVALLGAAFFQLEETFMGMSNDGR